ncbi:MAG: hypothetical protein ACT4QG_10310 [Sporichthyaceae bacterium]
MTTSGFLGMLPAVDGTVACGGVRHRVRWADGDLRVLDHADPEGERILAVLGGEAPGCIALLEAWQRCCANPSLLPACTGLADRVRAAVSGSEARTGIHLVSGLTASMSSSIRQGRLPWRTRAGTSATLVSNSDGRSVREDLLLVLAAGGGLVDRLAAQAVTQWATRAEAGAADGVATAALQDALTSRVWLALAGWLGPDAANVAVELTDGQVAARVTDGQWTVALPAGWLARVWAPRLAITAGRLVLAADRDGDALHLRTVGATGDLDDLTIR